MAEQEFEPALRELCPDGTCIGLIGPDGRCKVCGAVGASTVADPRYRGMRSPAAESAGAGDIGLDVDRELCPDDSCIGIIGADGRCTECGARAPDRLAPAAGTDARARSGIDGDVASGSDSSGVLVSSDDEDDDRELCPDGICIGLIGSDGRCKVCGTARPVPAP